MEVAIVSVGALVRLQISSSDVRHVTADLIPQRTASDLM